MSPVADEAVDVVRVAEDVVLAHDRCDPRLRRRSRRGGRRSRAAVPICCASIARGLAGADDQDALLEMRIVREVG